MALPYTSILAGASGQSSGYSISNSARFVSGNSAYLTRTPSVAPALRQGTISFWFKLGALGTTRTLFSQWNTTTSAWNILVRLETGDTLSASFENNVGANIIKRVTTQLLRDVGAWYHCVISWDSNLTTNSSCTVSLNGSAVSAFTTTTNPGAATDLGFNTNALQIGRGNVTNYFDGYLANFYYIDGSVVAASAFGQTNTSGVWVPKAYTGTYGTNGFLMEFKNSAALGTDTSGNGNTFTSSGLVAGDQFSDTPTLNWATLNPLNKASSVTLSSGNLVYTTTAQRGAYGTIGVSSGKWYWEWKPGATGSETYVGIGTPNSPTDVALDSGTPSGVIVYGGFNGNLFTTGAGAAYGATFTTGDTVGVALNMDAGTLTFYKNNTTQGTAASSLTGTKVPVVAASNTHSGTINFGQTAFTYTPPTGFVALNTTNLPAPAIKDGSAHFQTALHTGTGSALTINQSGNSTFTSDFVWTKGRSGATDHILSDILQGTGKYWVTNTASAQETNAQALTAFGSGSISYGTMAAVNTNAATYVDWMWKANGAGVSNTSGSISSTVSANTTAGISLVKWTTTGANGTVGHGLGITPGMIIFEELSTNDSHLVWHRSLTAGGRRLLINSTAAEGFNADNFNSTDPTSTVFSVGIDNPNLGGTSLAICFAPIAGFSAFGSYTGNGSAADGPFIYTGFRPAFVLPKRTDSTGVWPIQDTARSPYNVVDAAVFANQTSAETTGYAIDILSNGFKIRTTDANLNASGGTYIYAAFASNPFGGSGAAPATAR